MQTPPWRDAAAFTVEGCGWSEPDAPFTRLPARARSRVPGGVWDLSRNSAGVAVRFRCDSPELGVRWKLRSDSLAMPHMPATGVSGVDLYVRDARRWRFVQNGRPGGVDNEARFRIPAGRECLLYLPLYNGVSNVELSGALSPAPPRKRGPIVVYGTSIAQGGCASRPGMAWTAILGRALDRPVINLGFSGSGRMESAVADLLAELDPAAFVIDCLWNCGGMPDGELETRIEYLARTIRRARPRTPIAFVGQSHIRPDAHPTELTRRQEAVVRRLTEAGVAGLTLISGDRLMGDDGEGTVDGVHPNDLGMQRQADALRRPIARLLG